MRNVLLTTLILFAASGLLFGLPSFLFGLDPGRKITELGNRYGLEIPSHWGETIFNDLHAYDMQKLSNTLEYFPGIIEGIGRKQAPPGRAKREPRRG